MMANPIPLVPDLQKTFLETSTEEVKTVQPKMTPRPVPVEPPPIETTNKQEDKEKEKEIEEVIVTQPEPETTALLATTTDVSPAPPDKLEELITLERLSVTRKLQVKKVLSLKGKKNTFFVRTPTQELVYTVEEVNRWWVGYLCYGLRPMHLKVYNSLGTEVVRIVRPYAFTTRVLPCQLQRMQVYSPPGCLIGSIMQQWAPVRPIYTVKNAIGAPVFDIVGPRITLSCFQDVQFQVRRLDGTLVAATNKRWEGMAHALFFAPVKDKFGMTFFEKDMTGEEKALLLATALLFDYMYYDV